MVLQAVHLQLQRTAAVRLRRGTRVVQEGARAGPRGPGEVAEGLPTLPAAAWAAEDTLAAAAAAAGRPPGAPSQSSQAARLLPCVGRGRRVVLGPNLQIREPVGAVEGSHLELNPTLIPAAAAVPAVAAVAVLLVGSWPAAAQRHCQTASHE